MLLGSTRERSWCANEAGEAIETRGAEVMREAIDQLLAPRDDERAERERAVEAAFEVADMEHRSLPGGFRRAAVCTDREDRILGKGRR